MSWISVAIAVGAVFGALSRYYLTLFWIEKRGNRFPCGTLFVNLTGSLLIGVVSVLTTRYAVPVIVQKSILVGFLGAYTTFSSYILDAANLFWSAQKLTALFYWLSSPVLGFLCVELGIWFGHRLI